MLLLSPIDIGFHLDSALCTLWQPLFCPLPTGSSSNNATTASTTHKFILSFSSRGSRCQGDLRGCARTYSVSVEIVQRPARMRAPFLSMLIAFFFSFRAICVLRGLCVWRFAAALSCFFGRLAIL